MDDVHYSRGQSDRLELIGLVCGVVFVAKILAAV